MISIGILDKKYRHIKRLREILIVFVSYGFGELLSSLELGPHLKFLAKKITGEEYKKVEKYNRWERLRMAFQELGPTFIKFGQIMSNRPDLLPPELLSELKKFQDSVPPFDSEEALRIIEEDLGKPADQLFVDFENEPIAAASIAQVHRAKLSNNEKVAIKIRRPGIEKKIYADLEIMRELAELIEERIDAASLYRPVKIIDEFESNIRNELDMRVEASHIKRFETNFQEDKNIHVPRIYGELTGKQVLTMEYIDGVKAGEVNQSQELDGKFLADIGANCLLKQIFEHGFFHADPHPGNLFFMKGNVICFIDYGIMGRLDIEQREKLEDLLLAIANRDPGKATQAVLKLSEHKDVDERELEGEMEYFFNKYSYLSLEEFKFSEYISDITRSLVKHRVYLPSEYFMLIKSLITIEGVARQLNPDFNVVDAIRPYAEKILKQKYSISGILKRAGNALAETASILRTLPGDLDKLVKNIVEGEVKINLKHRGLDSLTRKLDQASNRVAYAIVLAALIIGSSLLVLADIPPHWHEMPIIGIIGFVGAAVMGFWLLLSILRHGKM